MLAIGVLQVVLFTAFSLYVLATQIHQQLSMRQVVGQTLLATAVPAIDQRLTVRDMADVRTYANRLADGSAVAQLEIRLASGELVFSHSKPSEAVNPLVGRFNPSRQYDVPLSAPIVRGGKSVAAVYLLVSNAELNRRINTVFWTIGVAFLVLLGIDLIASQFLIRYFVAPLGPLTMMATELTQGQWPTTVKPPEGAPELQHLSQAFMSNASVMRKQIGELERTRGKLAEREMRLRNLLDTMREVLLEMDAQGNILFLNPAWETLTGLEVAPCLNKPFQMFVTPPDEQAHFEPSKLPSLHLRDLELELRARDGKPVWVHMHANVRYRRNGELANVVATMYDVSEQRQLEQVRREHAEDLYQLTITDPLTGLFNRRHFDHVLRDVMTTRLLGGKQVALLIIDIDGFKFINDTYGHPVGDEVLKAVAHTLMAEPSPHDMVARLAGDEFAMILRDGTDDEFQRLSQEIHAKLSQIKIPLAIGQLKIQSSIGLALAPMHGKTPQDLVRAADVALYHAKRSGRNRVDILSKDRGAAIMDIFSQGFELRNALTGGAITPFLQPIVEVQTRQVVAYEVLTRLKRGSRYVAADEFILIAEELGLVREMDLYIIRQALLHVPKDVHLFLNISLSSFYTPEFSHELKKLLQSSIATGRSLTIEFTERQTTDMSSDFIRLFNDLRSGGCKIALDDFGAGYSTYSYLRRLKPDFVKIDGSFVQQVLKNPQDAKIVQHIKELSEVFGAQSIAEHVEDEATLQLLQKLGVNFAQGYLFGRPRPMHECIEERALKYG